MAEEISTSFMIKKAASFSHTLFLSCFFPGKILKNLIYVTKKEKIQTNNIKIR